MDCPACGGEAVTFPVPESLAEYLPDDRPGAALCTRCLTVTPVDDPPADLPDFQRVSAAFPRQPDRAVYVALVLAILDSIALYREEIDALATEAESRGVDPLLVLDRLGDEEDIDPAFDLEKRTHQLEQLLY